MFRWIFDVHFGDKIVSTEIDVLVIGSGVAGAMALARAKERGLRAYGISRSVGATGYSSGAIDWGEISDSAFKLFQKLTTHLNYTPVHWVATQVGTVRRCLAAQASQAFDLSSTGAGDLLGILEFSGLSCFKSAPVADMLNSQGYHAVPISIEGGAAQTFLEFARKFENPDFLDACLESISDAVAEHSVRFKHVFLPAVLGLSSPWIFLKSLEMRTGVGFSELLGLSHSVPGLRLGQILSQGFISGTVTHFKREDKKITQVELSTGEILEPAHIILATGRFLSGGFAKRESVFGLPLVGEERFKMGLAYDASQRPLGDFGELFAENLFAAGSSLGGYDPGSEGGMGVAIQTGYRAGDLCS